MANGIYEDAGEYHGKRHYLRADEAWYIWWSLDPEEWLISQYRGQAEPPLWFRADPDIEGDYQPGGSVGIATVTEI